MNKKVILVLDCGATNVRAVALNEEGKILAIHKVQNNTAPDPAFPEYIIWDIDQIWEKLCSCIRVVINEVGRQHVHAVTLTSFGVNGAPVDNKGNLLYPVISWQCSRTADIMEKAHETVPYERVYEISGVHQYSFNTLYSLLWLKEHRPEVLDDMEGFLFINSILVNRLTGELINDVTMAGTSMLTDIHRREFSLDLLSEFGLPDKFFELADPGTVAGVISTKCSEKTGLTVGIPVIIAGHDTQFSLLGSGAGENEVVLSSGTWEILMARSLHIEPGDIPRKAGLTHELDALPGIYNIGQQWLASGVVEWIKKNFYKQEFSHDPEAAYMLLEKEGREALGSSGQLTFNPELASGKGAISGIGIHTTRGQIYLSLLTALAERTAEAMRLVEELCKFSAESLIIAGGGSKNALWNQLRANALGIPLKVVQQSETTVLGAGLMALVATGTFRDIEEGADKLARQYDYIYPG